MSASIGIRANARGSFGEPLEVEGWGGVQPGEWSLTENRVTSAIELWIPLVLPADGYVPEFAYHTLSFSYREADRLAKLLAALLIGKT